jgi:Tfp pilus assembly protein FimT
MTLATGNRGNNGGRGARAFTLIELILVMAVLIMAVSIVMPALSRFFGGHKVDLEAKRFMSLIHYGRSRAASDGVPVILWVDPATGAYGLKQQPGYTDSDPKAVDHTVADGLKLDVERRTVAAPTANSQTGRILTGQTSTPSKNTLAIYFLPDGTINNALSVSGISIQDNGNPPVWIVPSANQLDYEVQNQNEHRAAARR